MRQWKNVEKGHHFDVLMWHQIAGFVFRPHYTHARWLVGCSAF